MTYLHINQSAYRLLSSGRANVYTQQVTNR